MNGHVRTRKPRRRVALAWPGLFVVIALSGCGAPPPDPAGTIQLQNRARLFIAGDTLDLRWRVDHAERVYIEARGAGGGARMLEEEGFEPVGAMSLRVDSSWLEGRPDGVAFRFVLLAKENSGGGRLRLIDMTQEIEVLTRAEREERRRARRLRQAPTAEPAGE